MALYGVTVTGVTVSGQVCIIYYISLHCGLETEPTPTVVRNIIDWVSWVMECTYSWTIALDSVIFVSIFPRNYHVWWFLSAGESAFPILPRRPLGDAIMAERLEARISQPLNEWATKLQDPSNERCLPAIQRQTFAPFLFLPCSWPCRRRICASVSSPVGRGTSRAPPWSRSPSACSSHLKQNHNKQMKRSAEPFRSDSQEQWINSFH